MHVGLRAVRRSARRDDAGVPHPRVLDTSPTAPQNPHPRAPSRLDGTRMSEASAAFVDALLRPGLCSVDRFAAPDPKRRPETRRRSVPSRRPTGRTHTHTRARPAAPWYHIMDFIKLAIIWASRVGLRPSRRHPLVALNGHPRERPISAQARGSVTCLRGQPRPCARACYRNRTSSMRSRDLHRPSALTPVESQADARLNASRRCSPPVKSLRGVPLASDTLPHVKHRPASSSALIDRTRGRVLRRARANDRPCPSADRRERAISSVRAQYRSRRWR